LQDHTTYPESVGANMNLSKNYNNFCEYSCGRWLQHEVMPPDKSDASLSFDAVSDEVEDALQFYMKKNILVTPNFEL
jgi:predicted metalloendopeptidase